MTATPSAPAPSRFGALAPRSLRARLLWFILGAIVLTALLQVALAYRTARAEADQIFDYQMQQMALALRSGLPVVPGAPTAEDGPDPNFEFVVQVWTVDGIRVFESASRTALPQRAVLGFTDVRARGGSYRVFSMQTRTRIIQVAQDMAVRRAMAGALALRTALPIALAAPLLMLAVWWVVSASMAPVSRVQRQLAAREADALDEVSADGLPAEIQPLVLELNALFARVRRAFDAQANFVADAAHELRSPLAALKLQVHALQRAVDDTTRAVAVQRLAAGIDRATRLVEQLLALARQQASAAAGTAAQPVALGPIVRQAVADAAEQADRARVDLGATVIDDIAWPAHPEALRILLRNLLDNALRHTPAGGRIDVALRAGSGGATLQVDDSGPGIPEAERARVLDRFYRVLGSDAHSVVDWSGGRGEPAASPEACGSGLGLPIVKSIADLHGATLGLLASDTLGGLRVEVRFGADAGGGN
ncbi:MAG: ATP-binding protein [Rubrivivax sp.]